VVKPVSRDDNGSVKKLSPLVLAAAVLTVACSQPKNRDFQRYYDPAGLFSTEFPTANNVELIPAEDLGAGGARILSGAISAPAQQPQGGPLSGLGSVGGSDQTIYVVLVLDPGGIASVEDLSVSLYTSDPTADVEVREPTKVSGRDGLLVVAAHDDQGAKYGSASGFLLGEGTAYWIQTAFPEGSWDQERADFLRVLRSFKTEAPPIPAPPLSSATA